MARMTPPPMTLPVGALATLLGALALLGSFAIDTYLPAFPRIQASLCATELEVQQTLTVYMLAFSAMTLWHGSISDAVGRRKVILTTLLLFGAGSVGCALAPTIEWLWAFRVLQGVSSGAGSVVGLSIIRDLHQGAIAARLLALVTMIFSIGPAIAPVIGGWIVSWLDWRFIFWVISGYACVVYVLCHLFLRESLPVEQRQAFRLRALIASYGQILRSRRFLLKAGLLAFNFSGMFLYVAGAPAFITRHLGLGPQGFAWQFVPMVSGLFLGSLLANRLSGTLPVARQISLGFKLSLGAGCLNVGYHLCAPAAVPWSVLPILVYALGIALIAPGATLLLLDLFPRLRGTASSCQAFILTLVASLTTGVLAPLLSERALWLACGQLTFGVLGLGCWVLTRLRPVAAPGHEPRLDGADDV